MLYLKSIRLQIIYCLVTMVFMLVALPAQAAGTGKVIINEFLALNSGGLQDEDGEYSDWIELYNPGATAVNLKNWSLTDDASTLSKWVFPDVTIGAGKYLVVFASGKDRKTQSPKFHTNFKLSGGGEYLALLEPGKIVAYEYAPRFPAQQPNVSYGVYMDQYTFFNTPTPGAKNTIVGQVLSPVFSVERGFFDKAFTVTLSVADELTKIYYTTDGTIPSAKSKLYTGPISITTTTPLSAVSIKSTSKSPTVVHTYFFVKDIANQPNNPAGYPDRWGHLNYAIAPYALGEEAPADYAMDPNVCSDPAYKNLIKGAFLAIPSVSIVTNAGYIFSHSTDPDTGGIYIYTGDSGNPKSEGGGTLGDGWERPASIEFYEPSTGKQFQINCGLRLHGGNSRKPYNSGKHSFRAHFKKQYGAGNLYYDLFDDETASDKFGHLIFRAGYNFSWLTGEDHQREGAQYTYDSFAKRTQLAMGHLATHDRFVHLFINGLYWGLYDITERVRNKFAAEYLGGAEEDYDVVDDEYAAAGSKGGAVEGDLAAFTEMLALAKAGSYDELLSKQLLDMENFIDYMLLNFYIGNNDWGKNNWYAVRNRVNPGKGFQFFVWDAENSLRGPVKELEGVDVNKIAGNYISKAGQYSLEGPLREMLFGIKEGGNVRGGLCGNAEFKMLLADRIQKHFLGEGVLAKEKTIARYQKLAAELNLPIILESARWGDYRSTTLPRTATHITYTRNDHWLVVKEDLLTNYFPRRTAIVFAQLRDSGLFPTIDAPVFSVSGGVVTDSFDMSMAATSGSIYFTTDNTDPRVSVTGAVSSTASLYSKPLPIVGKGVIQARVKLGNEWSALTSVTFYDRKEPIVNPDPDPKDTLQLAAPIAESDPILFYIEDDILYYTLPTEGNVSVEVFNINGNLVRQIGRTYQVVGTHQVDLKNLNIGIYICRLKWNKNITTRKIIKLY